MRKILPGDRPPLESARVQSIVDDLLRNPPASAIEEMQLQNQELIRAIDEARAREEEIGRVNQELAQTNTGVLALYDELETLHRVSGLLASQLELEALVQSIIDVTTELTSAELGAFFLRDEEIKEWSLHATSGTAHLALDGLEEAVKMDFFPPDFERSELLRIPDLEAHSSPCSVSHIARVIDPPFRVRGCLTVPIVAPGGRVLGAMFFASPLPDHFSERAERIVTSVATQAVLGIERARLFQAVKEASEAKDQFLAMVSHELRTPLNPVLAIVSSWNGDPRVPEELRDEVSMVARNIRLEARLIDDLLDFSKLISGKLQLDHSLVDLQGVIANAVEICCEELEGQEQYLEVTSDARLLTVAGDAARLQQVLWNVLKNAIKFTPKNGEIYLHTSNPTEDTLRIMIRDTGRGIEPEELSRIFGAFE